MFFAPTIKNGEELGIRAFFPRKTRYYKLSSEWAE